MAGHESLDSRDKGFKEGMDAYPDLTVVGNRVANNEEAEGMSLTADMLTKDPDLVGIFADNAQMGTGAGASIAEQRLGDKLCLVAFDSDAGELEHLKDGSIYALIIQDPYMMGFAGVWYGYAAAHGVRLPKDVDTGVGAVTKANMDDPSLAGLLDVTQAQARPVPRQLSRDGSAGHSGRRRDARPDDGAALSARDGRDTSCESGSCAPARRSVETYVDRASPSRSGSR